MAIFIIPLFTVKTFAVPCLCLHSQKNIHSYQLLQAFIVFMYKNMPENLCGYEKRGSFSQRMISNIRYIAIFNMMIFIAQSHFFG